MNKEPQSDQFPPLKQVLTVVLITLLATYFIGMLALVIGTKTGIFLLEAFIIVPALIFLLKNKYSPRIVFRLRPVNKQIIGISVIIGIAFTVVSDEIDRVIQKLFPMPEIFRTAIEQSLKIHSISDFIIIVFSAVFLAAILEEMLFRGFVQTSFENSLDITRSVMSTALIFAIVHFNPWWIIQVLIFGIILGVLAWKSNSIFPSIIIHLINNSISLIFTNVQTEHFQWYLYRDHVNIPILLAAILTTFYSMKLFYQCCDISASD